MKTVFAISFLYVSLWAPWCFSAAQGESGSPAPRYHLAIQDRPIEKRFLLTLRSMDDRPLCVPVEKWPNGLGQVHFGSSWVKLTSGRRVYPARDQNFGYCIEDNGGPCLLVIKPRGELKSFIAYAEFANPRIISALPKRRLSFPVTVWLCH